MASNDQVLDYLRTAIDQGKNVYVQENVYNYVDAIFRHEENEYYKRRKMYDSKLENLRTNQNNEINNINRSVDQESGRPIAEDSKTPTGYKVKKGWYKVKTVIIYVLVYDVFLALLLATKNAIIAFGGAALLTYGVYYFFRIQPRKAGDKKIAASLQKTEKAVENLNFEHSEDRGPYDFWRKLREYEEEVLESKRRVMGMIQSRAIVPGKYFNLNALCALLDYLESGQCSTLAEACTLYDRNAQINGVDTPTYAKEMKSAKDTITSLKRCYEAWFTEPIPEVFIDGIRVEEDLMNRRWDYEAVRYPIEKKYAEMYGYPEGA